MANAFNATESCTLRWFIAWYVNFTSVKKKKMREENPEEGKGLEVRCPQTFNR